MSGMTQTEEDNLRAVVQVIVDIAAPAIRKCIAAAQPGVTMCGELMTTEPVRDYRKEAWLQGFQVSHPTVTRDVSADATLEAFDKRFPK